MLVARRTAGCASADPTYPSPSPRHIVKRRTRREISLESCVVRLGDPPIRTMLAFATIAVACENCEQTCESQAKPRPDLGTHHESSLGVPALPERARWRRRPHHFVAVARRAVPPERRANPQ